MNSSGPRSASTSPSRPRRNASPRQVLAKKQQLEPEQLLARVQELESFKKVEEKEKKAQELAKKKELMAAKKKLTKEIQSATKEVRKHEKEANKLSSQLKKLHTQEMEADAKKQRATGKIDEQNQRYEKKKSSTEEDLNKKIEYTGAATGKLAHLEYAQRMLEQGIVVDLDNMKSGNRLQNGEESMVAIEDEPYREEVAEEVSLLRDEVERLQDENDTLRSKIELSQKTIESQSRRIEQMSTKMEEQQERLQTCETKLGQASSELWAAPDKSREISFRHEGSSSPPVIRASSYTPVVVDGVDVLGESRYATGTRFTSNATPRQVIFGSGAPGYGGQGYYADLGQAGYRSSPGFTQYGYEGLGSPPAPRPGLWAPGNRLLSGPTLVGGYDGLASSVPNLAQGVPGQGNAVFRTSSTPQVQANLVRAASPMVRVVGPGGQEIGAYESAGIQGLGTPTMPPSSFPVSTAYGQPQSFGQQPVATQVTSNGGYISTFEFDKLSIDKASSDFQVTNIAPTSEISTQTSKRGSLIGGANAPSAAEMTQNQHGFAKAVHKVTAQALRDYRQHHEADVGN